MERQRLARVHQALENGASRVISNGRQRLELLRLRINAADPARILGSGFAIVAVDGKRASVADVVKGKRMKLVLRDGTVEFEIGEVFKNCREE